MPRSFAGRMTATNPTHASLPVWHLAPGCVACVALRFDLGCLEGHCECDRHDQDDAAHQGPAQLMKPWVSRASRFHTQPRVQSQPVPKQTWVHLNGFINSMLPSNLEKVRKPSVDGGFSKPLLPEDLLPRLTPILKNRHEKVQDWLRRLSHLGG